MGHHLEVEGIISKLETVYRIVASLDVLMQPFYKISQNENEKIPAYTTRIEEALNQIRLKHPQRLDSAAIGGHLRE